MVGVVDHPHAPRRATPIGRANPLDGEFDSYAGRREEVGEAGEDNVQDTLEDLVRETLETEEEVLCRVRLTSIFESPL